MSFILVPFSVILSGNTPVQSPSVPVMTHRVETSTTSPNLEVHFEESVDEWFQRIRSTVQDSACFVQVKREFPTCVHVNQSILTTGWKTPAQNYVMLVNCENHPNEHYFSLPLSEMIPTHGEPFCVDDTRVWYQKTGEL